MLNYYKYRIPFTKPFKTAIGEFTHREGLVLTFEKEEFIAFGEAAPLPGFSNESLSEAEEVLQHHKGALRDVLQEGNEAEFEELITAFKDVPSATFGIETLYYDLAAKRAEKPLHEFLFNTPFEPVACNSTIGINSEEEAVSQAKQAIHKGFKTLKIKVGIDFEKEIQTISMIRKIFPSVNIRVDANQGWSEEEAIENLNALSKLNIEYCEQPVSKKDISGLKRVSDQSQIPVAADEAIRTVADIKKLIDTNSCDLIVLKPVLLGSYKDLSVTKKLLNTHNKELVLTTAFDGVIGRAMTAILASGLGSKKYGHGLATGFHLAEESSQQEIYNGFFDLPVAPGMGSPLSKNNLKSFTCV